MKKILVLCQNYPSPKNPFSQTFIHYRLKEYVRQYQVTVLSFASTEDYEYEGINVYTEKSLKKKLEAEKFDALISHAPNVRNHQRFILLNLFKLSNILFIFHGYEVINIHKRIYNQPTYFEFAHSYSTFSKFYHRIKLPLTCFFLHFINRIANCRFVFVSHSLLAEAQQDLNCSIFKKGKNTFVVNNPINPVFQSSAFKSTNKYDFICIRPFTDPKYGIDIFIKLAETNPQYSFHLFGLGDFPKASSFPENLKIFKQFIHADAIPPLLNNYKAAILPTRWDSQGVLACEIAALGMPLYTSDLEVCREMLSKYMNVKMIKNEIFHTINLDADDLKPSEAKDKFFSHANTTYKELDLVNALIENGEHN